MLKKLTRKFFNPLKGLESSVKEINSLEERFRNLEKEGLTEYSSELKSRAKKGEDLDALLPEAFALVRETARRTLRQRHFDVQLMGGIVLHQGKVAQMSTGEGKTLAATAPVYLNALSGKGVHVVTVNEYLARRDTVWMGQVYHLLGMSVSCLSADGKAFKYDPEYKIDSEEAEKIDEERDTLGSFKVEDEYLRPVSRKEAYAADITYGTNHEFGFDYLRDNLAASVAGQGQRPYNFAIVDEVDSILIDEARTPLIISSPDRESSRWYRDFARVVERLEEETDYTVDEKLKSVSITDAGIEKVERAVGVGNIYAAENLRLVHYLEESLKAKVLFKLDKDYVVREGAIVIVDEFTGRLMHGRRYSGGLHQAIEAKEGVDIKEESRTFAKISIQNYFKMYPKIAGMTGTAESSEEEFEQVYGLEVAVIPTNNPITRKDLGDAIYKDFDAKVRALTARIKEANEKGQPVLVGTTSIAKNELISRELTKAGVRHEMLNAKNHEREGAIIAQAGRRGVVTVATNMAGRGVDIILGGTPFSAQAYEEVKELGGLLVIGTERHEARRIDDQLRGRSGRQGDPGESQFYLSLDDDLLRVFGGEKIKNMLNRFDFPEDQPIEMRMVSRSVKQAQEKIEGLHFDARKHLLQFDDVLNKQRTAVYRYRQEKILELPDKEAVAERLREELLTQAESFSQNLYREIDDKEKGETVQSLLNAGIIDESQATLARGVLNDQNGGQFEDFLKKNIEERIERIKDSPQVKGRLLGIFDMLWMNHLEDMEALQESVRLRAYGQHDPLIEFRKEGHGLFERLFDNFRAWLFENIFRLSLGDKTEGDQSAGMSAPAPTHEHLPEFDKVGRNDLCPCGSGKKYKKCHGK